ncbi:MAG: hypothetical protein ACJ0BV_10075 [Paracoccaceae bacterium]|jgi:hypothetical protein|tara:strand:+ start:921 stop:1133 length:213 start_codon:yes stop_codon:yes gene_type:complete
MPKITIDDIDFNSEDLSESGKGLLASLQFVELHIKRLNDELAVLKTSKNVYENMVRKKLEAADKVSNKVN